MLPLGGNKQKMAEQKFPKGLRLKISEPFYKIFRDGNLGIRVDTPNELQLEEIIVKTNDEIRRDGREHFKSGNFLAALKTYFKGVVQYKDTLGVILNNRAQVEIKLEENEQALLDSAGVLMFEDNRKVKERYQVAASKLGLKLENISSIRTVWQRVLEKIHVLEDCRFESNKERGNEYYRKENYREAKKHYTALLCEQEVCFLLNNIAVACIKLCIFQTAIASAAACLRITVDKKVAAKSRYCMAKAFSLIGEFQFSKLSSVGEASCDRFWRNIQKAKSHAKMIHEYYLRDYLMSGESPTETLKKFSNVEIAGDYVNTDLLHHSYVPGKGRGLLAQKNIKEGELILVDHPVSLKTSDAKNKMELLQSQTVIRNHEKRYINTGYHYELASMILNIINFDRILAKKLLVLESRVDRIDTNEEIPLINLRDMAYYNLSYEVLPFMPQSVGIVDCDINKLSSSFIHNILKINCMPMGRHDERQA